MSQPISEFNIQSETAVNWLNHGKIVSLSFSKPIHCYLVKHRNEVIVVGDIDEFGNRNLIVYLADGNIRVRPEMPTLKLPVEGVYSLWFVEDQDKQNAILYSDNYLPYDTGCVFDLETAEFSDFHPSK